MQQEAGRIEGTFFDCDKETKMENWTRMDKVLEFICVSVTERHTICQKNHFVGRYAYGIYPLHMCYTTQAGRSVRLSGTGGRELASGILGGLTQADLLLMK